MRLAKGILMLSEFNNSILINKLRGRFSHPCVAPSLDMLSIDRYIN